MATFLNVYTHRKVADIAAKPCEVCYKPSTSVLVTSENKDFFYVCPVHLKDRKFCSPIIDEAAAAAKKKRDMEEEVERVKKEFQEKQKKKKAKERDNDNEKDKSKGNERDDGKEDTKLEEKKKDDESSVTSTEEEPRIFALQKAFYQQRIDKKRSAEMAKRNRERFQNPNLFPQVPKDFPTKNDP